MTERHTSIGGNQSSDMGATIEKLRQFDTATVCNVIELFDVRPHHQGYLKGSVRALFPEMPPMVGFAVTGTYTGASSGRALTFDERLSALAGKPEPRVIVLQSLEQPPIAAIFGDIACAIYKKLACVGLVTDGAGRDIEAVRRLGVPCFASQVICSHGYARFVNFDVPVTLASQEVRPGDLLHGDANGVAIVPIEIAGAVASLCRPMLEAEATLLKRVNDPGASVAEVNRAHREFVAQVEDMKRQAIR